MASDECQKILSTCQNYLEPLGFECYPFRVGDYNSHVAEVFRLPMAESSVGVLFVSLPRMFEDVFKPWLKRTNRESMTRDPLDQCMKELFSGLKEDKFASLNPILIHDYELTPTRRPKMLMQTVGHSAGAAYYYQLKDLAEYPQPNGSVADQACVYNVSVHPVYGGWFAYRGVLIFPTVESKFPHMEPPKNLKTDAEVFELLQKFTKNWRDGAYRDLGTTTGAPLDRYSADQQLYFLTEPADRFELIERWKAEGL